MNLKIWKLSHVIYSENPPKVEYPITAKRITIRPIVAELCNSDQKYQLEELNTRKDS